SYQLVILARESARVDAGFRSHACPAADASARRDVEAGASPLHRADLALCVAPLKLEAAGADGGAKEAERAGALHMLDAGEFAFHVRAAHSSLQSDRPANEPPLLAVFERDVSLHGVQYGLAEHNRSFSLHSIASHLTLKSDKTNSVSGLLSTLIGFTSAICH